jgi:rubrerythrin
MAGNEARHREELARRRAERDAPRRVTRSMLWDVEAPDYDEARAFMSARAALETALRSEKKAHAFFVAALLRITDGEVHTLFDELRREELEHQSAIRRQLAALPPEPGLPADDFSDDPVGQ